MIFLDEIFGRVFNTTEVVRAARRAAKQRRIKPKATITALSRVCPGGRHAWFESNVGLVRKPIRA